MANFPFKIRVRRRRDIVEVELMVPTSGSSWYVKERVKLGDGPLKEELQNLKVADLTAASAIKEVLSIGNT